MWNNFVGAMGSLPPDFPEKIDILQPFLYQINTAFWIWLIRVVFILSLVMILFFAYGSPGASHLYSEEFDKKEKMKDEYETAPIHEEKVTK